MSEEGSLQLLIGEDHLPEALKDQILSTVTDIHKLTKTVINDPTTGCRNLGFTEVRNLEVGNVKIVLGHQKMSYTAPYRDGALTLIIFPTYTWPSYKYGIYRAAGEGEEESSYQVPAPLVKSTLELFEAAALVLERECRIASRGIKL